MLAPFPSEWRTLPISLTELCINTTLRCGQSFRWRKTPDDQWSMALHGRIISLRQDATHLHYRATFPSHTNTSTPDNTEALLHHYFNLSPNLSALYTQWSAADPNFARRAPAFTGIRILQQDAWEALIGFICSSNNNIARISQMVHKLCIHYGPLIGHLDGEAYHDFPTPKALTGEGVEAHLRELGFGYRAKYLWKTARMVVEKETEQEGWLEGLRNPERPVLGGKAGEAGDMQEGGREGYRRAHEALLALQGVGPKVADCMCLMGLGWGEAVPVDTHVWQIAVRDYKFGKGKHSSLTKATYDAVGNKFRALWGKEAGWAHSVLFTADLKSFSERLASKIEKNEEVDGIVKQEIKMENGDGIGGEEAKVVKKEIEKEIKTEDDTGEVEHKATKSRKRKVITTVKSEFVLESAIKMEHELDESVLEEGSMLDRVKRRRRVK